MRFCIPPPSKFHSHDFFNTTISRDVLYVRVACSNNCCADAAAAKPWLILLGLKKSFSPFPCSQFPTTKSTFMILFSSSQAPDLKFFATLTD